MKRKKKRSDFGQALVMARLQLGICRGREIRKAELAKQLGITQGYLSSLESGRKFPNIRMLSRIIEVYPAESVSELRMALKIEDSPVGTIK